MSNPLIFKILSELTASKTAKFSEGLDANSQKITNVSEGVSSADAVNLGQLTSASSSLLSYANSGDVAFQNTLNSQSGSLKSYIDSANSAQDQTTSTLSSSIRSYVDTADSAQNQATTALSSSIKSYADVADGVLQSNLNSVSSSIKSYVDTTDGAQNEASSTLSSSIKSYIDAADGAQDQATSTLSSSIKSYVDAADLVQDQAASALSSSIKNYVDAADEAQNQATSTLSSSISSSVAAEKTARIDEDLTLLKLDGSRAMSGSLNMGEQDIVSAKSGSFSGNLVISGNLQANGSVTSINTSNLEVTDKLITIAKGAINAAAAEGAGIEVDSAGAKLSYDRATNDWVSNIGLTVEDGAIFESTMKLSGSAFTNITTSVSGGTFDVSEAIHELDIKVGSNAAALSTAYDTLRSVITGTIDTGSVAIELPFATSDLSSVALDIMVNEGLGYTNDLVSAKMSVIGSKINVTIDAPTTSPGALYRLIAVNAKRGGFLLNGGGQRISTLLTGLAAFYKLDGNGLDSLGGHNGTGFGAWGASSPPGYYVAGKFGSGFSMSPGEIVITPFDGHYSTYMTLSPGVSLGMSWTLACWHKMGGTPSGHPPDHVMTNDVHGEGLKVAYGGKMMFYSFYETSLTNVSAGWHHLAMTYDGSVLRYYLDGVADGTANIDGWGALLVDKLLGAHFDKSAKIYVLDEAGMWTRPLSPSEIAELYNGGAGLSYPF